MTFLNIFVMEIKTISKAQNFNMLIFDSYEAPHIRVTQKFITLFTNGCHRTHIEPLVQRS